MDEATTDRRGQILSVAARLFAEYGFETTSVRQIADEVQILPGSLYHHFDTKEDMLHEILRAPLARIVRENVRIAGLPLDAERRLVASVIMRFLDSVARWEVHVILQNDGKFFRRRDDFAYVQDTKSQSFRVQEETLQDGMAAGLFRRDIDTYLMIGTIARMLSTAAGWFRAGDIYSAVRPVGYDLEKVIEFHVDCILRMVRVPERLGDPLPLEECRAACTEQL